jgi:SP family sugar:H+ symporter-like MFS transporter
MQPYNKAFGRCGPMPDGKGNNVYKCTLTATQQSLISLSIIFIALGSALGGHFGHHLGRRGTIQIGCLVIAIGAGGMLGTAGNFTAYMACKSIQGVGLGHLLAAVPPYGVECVAASKRGLLMATFNIGLGLGNMAAVAVCLGSSKFTTNVSWQTPIACQLPCALLLGIGVNFFPESPRWLLSKGKHDAARNSFAKFYSKAPESPEVSAQIQETLHYLDLEKSHSATSSWTEIFRSPDLRRTLTSTLVGCGVALTGSKFFSTYASIFLAGVGIRNPYHITLSFASCACFGGLISPWILEYVGRRLSLLVGYACMALCMLIVAAMGTGFGQQNSSVQVTSIVFVCLWGVSYGGFIGTSLTVTTAEMHAVRLRGYGQAFTITIYEIMSFGSSFSTPYMLSAKYGNMGLNVGYFFGGKFYFPLLNRIY